MTDDDTDDMRVATLGYAAKYHQIAERLFKRGYIALGERSELAACEAMIVLAVAMRLIPVDTLPADFVDRVDAALARAPMDESSVSPMCLEWN